MSEPSFDEAQEGLAEKFLRDAPVAATDAELGRALLVFILESERLRRGVSVPSPAQEKVDRQTLACLSGQAKLGPGFSFAEAVFRRLPKDPASAIRYFEEELAGRKAKQSARAKSPRKGSYDSITRLINDIVDGDPHITTKEVLAELGRINGIVIADGEIRNTQDVTTMKVSNLPSRVSDAKKRSSGQPG